MFKSSSNWIWNFTDKLFKWMSSKSKVGILKCELLSELRKQNTSREKRKLLAKWNTHSQPANHLTFYLWKLTTWWCLTNRKVGRCARFKENKINLLFFRSLLTNPFCSCFYRQTNLELVRCCVDIFIFFDSQRVIGDRVESSLAIKYIHM